MAVAAREAGWGFGVKPQRNEEGRRCEAALRSSGNNPARLLAGGTGTAELVKMPAGAYQMCVSVRTPVAGNASGPETGGVINFRKHRGAVLKTKAHDGDIEAVALVRRNGGHVPASVKKVGTASARLHVSRASHANISREGRRIHQVEK